MLLVLLLGGQASGDIRNRSIAPLVSVIRTAGSAELNERDKQEGAQTAAIRLIRVYPRVEYITLLAAEVRVRRSIDLRDASR
jgi:hypothetical protein